MDYLDRDEFGPDDRVFDEIEHLSGLVADLSYTHKRQAAVRFLQASGIAMGDVNLGRLSEETPYTSVAVPVLAHAYTLVETKHAVNPGQRSEAYNVLNLLGYAYLMGASTTDKLLREMSHVTPRLVWGIRGTLQLCGMAMQRVYAYDMPQEVEYVEEFIEGQQQVIRAGDEALAAIGAAVRRLV